MRRLAALALSRANACLIVLLAAALVPADASAQCGAKRTECRACHTSNASMNEAAPWHRDHAFTELCDDCHGGQFDATDALLGHATMVAPLGDPIERCGSCHDDAAARADKYRSVPTPATNEPGSPGASPPTVAKVPPHGDAGRNILAAGIIAALAIAWATLAYQDRERRRSRPHAGARSRASFVRRSPSRT